MPTFSVIQDYSLYHKEDHETWAILCKRQNQLGNKEISGEYLDGYRKLKLNHDQVIKLGEISDRLEIISGWTLVPVTGLIPTKDFFYLIVNKKYPVTVSLRKPSEVDFSEQPDIFHDVCGHLPLLTNEKFTKFLTAFGMIALKYVNNERAIEFLGRLYWYTYEMGIIKEEDGRKAYGGAIITSAQERANVNNRNIPKYPFSLDLIFHTPYNPYKLQNEYFVINSFDDLFNVTDILEEKLIENLLLSEQDYALGNLSLKAW